LFNPKPFKDANFWFTSGLLVDCVKYLSCFFLIDAEKEARLDTTDILESVTGSPSEHKAAKEEENKMKEKEQEITTQKLLVQQV
jgi:hypothetical protein